MTMSWYRDKSILLSESFKSSIFADLKLLTLTLSARCFVSMPFSMQEPVMSVRSAFLTLGGAGLV